MKHVKNKTNSEDSNGPQKTIVKKRWLMKAIYPYMAITVILCSFFSCDIAFRDKDEIKHIASDVYDEAVAPHLSHPAKSEDKPSKEPAKVSFERSRELSDKAPIRDTV